MKVLTVACQKGGVGKSTLAVNLSAAFSLMESFKNPQEPGNILLIDMDVQHHASKTLSGGVFGAESDDGGDNPTTLGQCLMGKTPLALSDIAKESHLPEKNKNNNLHYLPTEIRGMEEAKEFLRARMSGPFRLSDLIQPLASKYEYIIIDTPPNLEIMTENALMAATHVVVPIDLQAYSMDALNATMEKIKEVQGHPRFNPQLQLAGIVLTKCNLRHSEEVEWLEVLRELYGDLVLSPITYRGDVHTAQSQGLDIFSYKPPRDPESIASSSLATQEYASTAEKIKDIIDNS